MRPFVVPYSSVFKGELSTKDSLPGDYQVTREVRLNLSLEGSRYPTTIRDPCAFRGEMNLISSNSLIWLELSLGGTAQGGFRINQKFYAAPRNNLRGRLSCLVFHTISSV